ncbi:hypothetical protein GCM10009069_23830 [Algimonas arctica]|uniref:Schlafen AlbA-2 domain-containing protein n=1 Tax=Algimonas arctica TaxID=1479486 RepID=A0A8J3G390_9PROT|nr:RNA-binding domain-containing protein [Algimonas arctica]GHB00233.1 hypothetical protein GCM10009069_23830 [Algimonas arctica]
MDLYRILEEGIFPSDEIAFVKGLLNPSEANLLAQESEILDYKENFPESFSSDFGASIIRLCIGFHNSHGGFICFGVNDKTRLPFCGKANVDIERLNKKIIEVCSRELRIKHLALPAVGVDILLCPKRPSNKSPVYLSKPIGKYSEKSCWRRVNQEVRLIEGRGAKLLLSARNHDERNQSGENEVSNPYPASRSTIESFIGRTDYLIKLHEWLLKKRDKVAYLYGRGGSGKTKIAYEFGDIIHAFPNDNPISSKSPATKVLFLSAKEKELRTADATIRDIAKTGFGTSDELFKRIVFESELANNHPMLFDYTSEKIEDLMFDAFDTESFLIIIDDIDTLTTKNQESGLSVLGEAVSSASFPSKILVTQRNRPIDALRNAIHVTGFNKKSDFRAFLLKCCEKFETDYPDSSEETRLLKISEGILMCP